MCSPRDNAALPALGFPIRKSAGHRLLGASPRLIAAAHVLHRLLVPRHPPYALPILTVIDLPKEVGDTQLFGQLCSFQGPPEARARGDSTGVVSKSSSLTGAGRSLKTQQRVCGAQRAEAPRARAFRLGPVDIPKAPALSSGPACLERLPRKEVIQPHLPVRLPCYDFTPITSPTFDGSLP
jgi:hypothetical protein